MELASLHTLAMSEEGASLWLTYKLLRSEDGRYGILCYVEGVDYSSCPHSVAQVDDYCANRERAEATLKLLAQRQVMPAHLVDLLWEI